LFDNVVSLDDIVPKDQPAKLAVLAEIRTLLTSKDIEQLDEDERKKLEELIPPETIPLLRDTDIPDAIAWPFIEADQTRGKIVLATIGKGYEVWDTRDTTRWAAQVRAIGLPDDVHLGGASFVFADVIAGVLSDGPRATLAAALGAILIVLLVIGPNRFGAVTIACGLSGTILMLGISALLGLKVNFLDFVALPITIGIGIEYAVNIVTRARQEGLDHGREVVGSTGGAVVLCSYTTTVGYGSLLLSQNLGIRSFGIAAMLGEITCLVVALFLAPALLALLKPKE
jgi:predicted RND superfamily exporter protein